METRVSPTEKTNLEMRVSPTETTNLEMRVSPHRHNQPGDEDPHHAQMRAFTLQR